MPTRDIPLREVSFPADTQPLQALIREYVAWLDMDLSYRGFEAEMANFETLYAPPGGTFFLAEDGAQAVGCAGLLSHGAGVAELKRVYVRPAWRGLGLGERLVQAVARRARGLGFTRLVLDAVPQTTFAQRLYLDMGFTPINPYYADPVPGTKFFELALN